MRQIVAIDLDGTLISGNSLHEYVKGGICVLWRRRQIAKLLNVYMLLAARSVRIVSHSRMKWGCYRVIGKDAEVVDCASKRMRRLLSPVAESLLAKYRAEGCDVVVATASFDFLAQTVAEGDCIATSSDGREECRGERKAAALQAYVERTGSSLVAVITDHYDDAPMLKMEARDKIVVRPSKKTVKILAKHSIEAKIIS